MSYERNVSAEFPPFDNKLSKTHTDQFIISDNGKKLICVHELIFRNPIKTKNVTATFSITCARDFPHIVDFQAELIDKNTNTTIAKFERRTYVLTLEHSCFDIIFDADFGKLNGKTLIIHYSAKHDVRQFVSQDPLPSQPPKLRNGAYLCFFNVIIQSLFNIQQFRRIIFSINAEDTKTKEERIINQLQLLFVQMYQPFECKTNGLRNSFEWHEDTAKTTQDASEFYVNLTTALEIIFTPHNEALRKYNDLLQIEYESVEGNFIKTYCLDLTLDANTHNIEEALKQFVYDSDGNQIRSLKKIPDVFVLHIPRSNDINNDYVKYPGTLNLNGIAESLSDQCEYELFNVVVHTNGVYCGHYYAYARRSEQQDMWFKLNDTSVSKVSKMSSVFEENYGAIPTGIPTTPNPKVPVPLGVKPRQNASGTQKSVKATMLFYIKKNKIREVMKPVLVTEFPSYAKYTFLSNIEPMSLRVGTENVSWSTTPYIVANQLEDYEKHFKKGELLTSTTRGIHIIAENSQMYQKKIDILLMKDKIAKELDLNRKDFTIWKTTMGVPSYQIKEEFDIFARGDSTKDLSPEPTTPTSSNENKAMREYITSESRVLYIDKKKIETKMAMFNVMAIEFDPIKKCRIMPQKFILVGIRTTVEKIAEALGIDVNEYEFYRYVEHKPDGTIKGDLFLSLKQYERLINHNKSDDSIGFTGSCSIYVQKRSTMSGNDISKIEGEPISFFEAIEEKEPQSLPNVYMMSLNTTMEVTFINELYQKVTLKIPKGFDDIKKFAGIFGDRYENPFVTLHRYSEEYLEPAKLSNSLKRYFIAIHNVDPKRCPRTVVVQYLDENNSIITRFVIYYRDETGVDIVRRMREKVPELPEDILLVAIVRGRIISLHIDHSTYTLHEGDIVRLQALPKEIKELDGVEFRYVEHSFENRRSECWGIPSIIPILPNELSATRNILEKQKKGGDIFQKTFRGDEDFPMLISEEEEIAANNSVNAVFERISAIVGGNKFIICNYQGTEPEKEIGDLSIVADPAYRVRILDKKNCTRTINGKVGDITIRL